MGRGQGQQPEHHGSAYRLHVGFLSVADLRQAARHAATGTFPVSIYLFTVGGRTDSTRTCRCGRVRPEAALAQRAAFSLDCKRLVSPY
jgi:hypothetical protein